MVGGSRIGSIVTAIVTAPVTLAVILFAVSNRHPAELRLWPLVGSAEVPLYLVGLATMLIGFLFGAAVAWFGAGTARARARTAERDLRVLRTNLPAAAPDGGRTRGAG